MTIDTIEHHRKVFGAHKLELEKRFQVESLLIFGSVRRGTAKSNSDLDILVRYHKTPGMFKFLDLKHYLERLVDRPVDLVTEAALKKTVAGENFAGGCPCRLENGNFVLKIYPMR